MATVEHNDIMVRKCSCSNKYCGFIEIKTNILHDFTEYHKIKNNCFTLFTFLLNCL